MIREAIEKIIEMVAPTFKEIEGMTYSSKDMKLIERDNRPGEIGVNTLSGLVEYLTDNVDKLEMANLMVHVVDHKNVRVFDKFQPNGKRNSFIRAQVDSGLSEFRFGNFMDQESFCIALNTLFEQGEKIDSLVAMAGNIQNQAVTTATDDGISQKVTAKSGTSVVQKLTVPNPHFIAPFRTFREIKQPVSPFVFRVNKAEEITCALFEADGGKWRLEAIQSIKEYLKEALRGISIIG
jgi:hypothetical protein